MVMRIGGLASGMDIDALVEKLMSAERSPLNKLQQKKQTYEWQRDAYRSVNTKLKTFDTYIADNLVLKTLNSKTATSSNSNLVSAIATGSASGSLSIEGVSQLATAARAVGNQVSAIGSTKMSDLVGSGTKTIELKGINKDGSMPAEYTKIEITDGMTVDQFVSRVNASNAGVSAVFENGRFSFTAKNTGDNKAGDEIQIADNSKAIMENLGFFKDSAGQSTNKFQTVEGKNAIFQVNGIATERASNSFTISGYQVTLKDTFNSTKTFYDKYTAAAEEKDLAATNLTNKESALSTAKTNYYGSNISNPPSFTATHDSAYKNAFGSASLTFSQQETYKKLSSTDWGNLSATEFEAVKSASSATDYKEAIDNNINLDEASKTKLKALSTEKVATLATLNSNDFDRYKTQVNYESYGTKLKDLTDTSRDALQALKVSVNGVETEITADTDMLKIHEAIDANSAFTDEMKTTLKSLDKDALLVLKNSDDTTLDAYAAKAKADDLKTTYSKLGDAKIQEITADPSKVATLSAEQQTAWNSLTADQKTAFNAIAEQNTKRAQYLAANAEYEAAITRNTNAQNNYNTAVEDAKDAGVLNDDGTVNQSKIDNAASTPPVTMTSTTNIDEMVNKIKEFVTTYNGLIKDLSDQTKESKYRDYQPLTAEQRKDMDEDEIKLWEEKAKSGLLRNDSLIRNGLSNMRSLVYETNYAIEDTRYNTLFSIGITTSKSYNDGGTLEIDETKLRKALEENPDAVEQLFKNSTGKKDDTAMVKGQDGKLVSKTVDTRGYLAKLRESMKSFEINIEKKAGRSTMTDAEYAIGKNLMDNEKRISSWERKLKDIEARYWKQFTAMESAINKANQQSSMFMQG